MKKGTQKKDSSKSYLERIWWNLKPKVRENVEKFSVRKIILALADAFIVVVASLISNFILTPLGHSLSTRDLAVSMVVSVFTCFAWLNIAGAYNKLWRYFNGKDYLLCLYGVLGGVATEFIIFYLFSGECYILYTLLHALITVIGISLFRYLFKDAFISLVETGMQEAKLKRTMIIGAGRACRLILSELRNSDAENRNKSDFNPVCIIDDDSTVTGSEIDGVPIVGTTGDIKKMVEQNKIEQIIFAIPSCLEDERKRILDICSSAEVPIKVIPFISDLIFDDNNNKIIDQIRDIRVEDLLGREPIKFDNDEVRNFISGKVCMVTGGGGAIGSELVRRISK